MMRIFHCFYLFTLVEYSYSSFVINTWSGVFEKATNAAYSTLLKNGTSLDAIEIGCSVCEHEQCDSSVGFGNHPDTESFTSLDAMIMDGDNFDVGSVGYIRNFRNAISIARSIMIYTSHTLLVGQGAENFALMMGFLPQSATTDQTKLIYNDWKDNYCQPNFYENIPKAESECGPYSLTEYNSTDFNHNSKQMLWQANKDNHDTIGMISIDNKGSMACGTTTNGANHKIAGRVGDSPITGAGCYVDSNVGGCAATGDGDIMMRFLPSFYAVLLMEGNGSDKGNTGNGNGGSEMHPQQASERALERIVRVFPSFSGGIVCINKYGSHGGAAHNMAFTYSYVNEYSNGVSVVTVADA